MATKKTFLEKEKEMIQRYKETAYDEEDFQDSMELLSRKLTAFPSYCNCVIMQQQQLPILYSTRTGEDLRDKVMQLDDNRKTRHDACIDTIKMLNRHCEQMGLEPFADVDVNDRYAIADFVGEYISETYNHGIGKTFDDATLNKDKTYDESKINKRVRSLEAQYGHLLEGENAGLDEQYN